jgi:hypothetical protein
MDDNIFPIKTRARRSDIRDNHIVDGHEGEASYGAESKVWPENSLTLEGNTLISDTHPGGWFLRVHEDKFPTPPRFDIGNNETKGIGIFTPVLQ